VPAALGLDLHTVSIAIEGSRIAVDPPNDAVKVSLNPSGRLGIRQIDDLTYEITGAVEKTTAFHNRFSVADPALYAGGVFLTLIRKQGIAVSGTVKRGIMPAHAREVARLGSPDLKAVIRETNRQSLNVAADNMLFMLGALTSGLPGTREKGIQAVNGFLRELGVPLKGLVIDDGSGVSERNRVSAEQMVEFLRLAAGRPWFTAFHESLSRPGMDGRLKDFGYRSERIRMKSGQLTDAYGLAGYIDRLDGKKIAFAYLVNGSGLDAPTATSGGVEVWRQLELCRILIAFLATDGH
jgi:D-alanyl-D-alanine carboxypeptidase/D-alanyl-D-alanine-endopeptidase (penicillin-binding protein 4)